MSGSTWVHVATLLNWNRPPVGIVRVEQEYCRWLLARNEPGVRFCLYDKGARTFAEVPAERVAAHLAGPEAAAAYYAAQPKPELAGWKRAVKKAWYTFEPLLPAQWAAAARKQMRLALHHALQAKSDLRAWLAGPPAPPAPPPPDHAPAPPPPFAHSDRFVSLGLDWEYLDQARLYRLKQEYGLRVTLICYDVIPLLYPHLVVLPPGNFGAYAVDMAWCADAVLCISEHTRDDFERVMARVGAPVPPTHVIRLGADIDLRQPEAPPPALAGAAGERPFVLFVSTIERRKNHEILYRAWTRLRDGGLEPHRLVFVGMPGWGVTDLMNDLKLDPRVQDDVLLLNHVGDAELAWLYRHAAFTVFPSLYEGWGLPVVESLARGKFCLSSNAASLPEAGGEWAEYLDPWDLPAWVERLGFYMRNPQEVEARNARIAAEFTPPTWAACAQTIHDVAMSAGAPRA